MAGLKDVAKKVGLNPLKLEDGKSINLMELLEELFIAIADECRQKGGSVRIKDFGTFSAKLNKGRKLKTPLMEGGEVEFGDILLLKFHQSTISKKRMNDKATIEEWGGKYIEKKLRPSDIKKAETAEKKKEEKAKKKSKKTADKTESKKEETVEEKPKKSANKKAPVSKKSAPKGETGTAKKSSKKAKKAPVSKKSSSKE